MPLLDTYRQMAVRQQKAKNWAEALHWAQRGLALYGDGAARPEAVDDLKKRIAAYSTKVSGGEAPKTRVESTATQRAVSGPVLETLTCAVCGDQFTRQVARGRKPKLCSDCRS